MMCGLQQEALKQPTVAAVAETVAATVAATIADIQCIPWAVRLSWLENTY